MHFFSIDKSYGRGAGVGRGLGDGASLGVGVGLAVDVGVAVAVEVGVAVAVDVAVAVAVGVRVAVGVGVAVAVGVGVGVGPHGHPTNCSLAGIGIPLCASPPGATMLVLPTADPYNHSRLKFRFGPLLQLLVVGS